MRIGEGLAHAIGWAAMASVAALIGFCGVRRAPIRLFGWSTPLPNARQALAQVGVAVADLACASGALFVLVPDTAPALLPAFVLAYALGIVATALSHVPGGVGVFEAVLIAALPGDRTAMLAALLVYRLVYYLLPLAAGIVLLAWHEGARRRRWRGRLARRVGTVARGVAPLASSAATFLGGAMLLLSGSLGLRGSSAAVYAKGTRSSLD